MENTVKYNDIFDVVMSHLNQNGYIVTIGDSDCDSSYYGFDSADDCCNDDGEWLLDDVILDVVKCKQLNKYVFAEDGCDRADGWFIYCNDRETAFKFVENNCCDKDGYAFSHEYIDDHLDD